MARTSVVMAVALVTGCGAAPARIDSGPGISATAPLNLVVDATASGAVRVANERSLRAQLATSKGPFAAPLEPIVGLTWRMRTFDKAVLAEAVAASRDHKVKQRFRARHQVGVDELVAALMAGYSAQLEQRYGVVSASASPRRRGGQLVLGMEAYLAEGEGPRAHRLQWTAGTFEYRGRRKLPLRPTMPGPPATTPLVTVIKVGAGPYYQLPDFHFTSAYFRPPIDGTRAGSFHGKVKRVHFETLHVVTAGGREWVGQVATERWTPYYILRPGGPNPYGLTKRTHLASVVFDETASPLSAPMIESLTVLPLDLDTMYPQLLRRFDRDRSLAVAKLSSDVEAARAEFESASTAWVGQHPGPVSRTEAAWREYGKLVPRFRWHGDRQVLSVVLSRKRTFVHTTRVFSPNPALATFRCRSGQVCALPPEFIEDRHRRKYHIDFSETYEIDAGGNVTRPATSSAQFSR